LACGLLGRFLGCGLGGFLAVLAFVLRGLGGGLFRRAALGLLGRGGGFLALRLGMGSALLAVFGGCSQRHVGGQDQGEDGQEGCEHLPTAHSIDLHVGISRFTSSECSDAERFQGAGCFAVRPCGGMRPSPINGLEFP